MSVRPTGTHHPLPFGDLSPADFERICLWLVEREGFENAIYIGARGQDRGRDIEAWQGGARVVFQCKRVQDFKPHQAVGEIEKLRELAVDRQPTILYFLLTCNPTAGTIDAARAAWGDSQTCRFWGRDHLDERVNRYADILRKFFQIEGRKPQGYRCQAPHPGRDFVHREQLDQMAEHLTLAAENSTTSTLAITTALRGAGGFGKTTLAQALCHDQRIRTAYPDGILWAVMGENMDDAGRIGAILEPVRWWSRTDPPAFESANGAGAHLRDLLGGHRVLVVVDDVWHRADVRPFEGLGAGSALLITTRNRETLPLDAQPIDVDQMEPREAAKVLGSGTGADMILFEPLAHELGAWPLLLTLVNGQLRKLTRRKLEVTKALERVEKTLRARGLQAFDRRDAEARDEAVRLTMAAGFESDVLSEEDQARYRSLAIFPEDTDIPLDVLAPYWGLDGDDAFELAERLFELSLLLRLDYEGETLRLHDVFRHYLIDEQGPRLAELNHRFLDAHLPASGRWTDLSQSADYLWRHLAYHLLGANKEPVLSGLLIDPDYLQGKLCATGVNALLADFETNAADSPRKLIADALRKSAHCLSQDASQMAAQLIGRLAEGDGVFQEIAGQLRSWPGLKPRRGSLRPVGDPFIRAFTGHAGWVLAVEGVGDGRIVSASEDGSLRVWDAASGECLRTLEGHAARVRDVQYLGSGRVVSASSDRTLKVWDLDSGECLRTLGGHKYWVRAVRCMPDGRIVSASDDKTLRVWDVESGECLLRLEGHTAGVRTLEYLGSGRIVSGSGDKTLRVWDIEAGECLYTLKGHSSWVTAIERLGDDRVVSASEDRTLRVWDIETGKCLQRLEGHTAWVGAVKRLDDERVVSASLDNTLRVWETGSGRCILTLQGHTGGVGAIELLKGGRLVSASDDGTLRLWNIESGKCLNTLRGHTKGVGEVERLEGGRIVSASDDGTLRLWDVELEVRLNTVEGHSDAIGAVRHWKGGQVVSVSYDQTLRVWEVESGECLHILQGHNGGIEAVVLDSGKIVSASSSGTLLVWDCNTGDPVRTLEGHSDQVLGIEHLECGRIVSASFDRTLRVWNVDSGDCLHKLEGHFSRISAIRNLKGGRIVSGSFDRTLRVWCIDSGTCLHTLRGHTSRILTLESLVEGRIVSASENGTLRVWDVESEKCLHTLKAHASKILAIADLEGGRIVSASENGTLREWDIESGKCLSTLQGHKGRILALEHLEGDRVVSTSSDGTLRVWDVDRSSTLAVFTAEDAITAVTVINPHLIVVGDASGRVHILDLVE